jgi:putative pyruvate formate lyase activating enzyme
MKSTRREFLGICAVAGASLFSRSSAALAGQRRPEGGWVPAYERLESEGKLADRVARASAILEKCQLCPRQCGVNRLKGETGFCRAPLRPVVFSAHPHFGEEMPITGQNGSGTIFFSHCNLRCVFCQNWPIAHEGRGQEISEEQLAETMLHLQEIGCHNINLVTPTHVMPSILTATRIASKKGLRLPLFYNTSGYERVEILKILDGVVDLYKPDMKYADPEKAAKYSAGASDYPELVRQAVLEMHRQVGLLTLDRQGIALRGLVIRHLVMPNRVAGSQEFAKWVSENLPKTTYVNIMAQYRVEYRAFEYPEIARGITIEEFLEAMEWAKWYGLTNLDPHSVELRNLYQRRRD